MHQRTNLMVGLSAIHDGLEKIRNGKTGVGFDRADEGLTFLRNNVLRDVEDYQSSDQGLVESHVRALLMAIDDLNKAFNDPSKRPYVNAEQSDIAMGLLALGKLVGKLEKPDLVAAE